MTNDIDINQLQVGDILLLSGEKKYLADREDPLILSLLRFLITFLTDSEVSHCALYRGQEEIIELVAPKIRICQFDSDEFYQDFRGRKIYVNRLNKDELSKEPVINAANEYYNQGTRFAWTNWLLVGLILLYKATTLDSLVKTLMIRVFQGLAVLIMMSRDRFRKNPPMVCSQFVFQCYKRAGNDYHLIKKPSFKESPVIIEQVIEHAQRNYFTVESPNLTDFDLESQNILSQNEEELAQELLEELQSTSNQVGATNNIDNEFALAVQKLGEALYLVENNTDVLRESRDLASNLRISKGLALLMIGEAYFSTPEDLLYNCENLVNIGFIKPIQNTAFLRYMKYTRY